MKAHLQVRSEWQSLDYLRVAMEHATEEARKKYLKDHPNADPKNHTIQKSPGLKSGPSESRVKKFLQSANTVMRKAWESSSDSVKRFVSDPVERKKMARDMTKAALSFGPKASKKFGQMLAGEAKAIANDTPAILAAAAGVARSVKVERTDKKGKKETIWVAEGLLKPDGKGSYTSDDPRYEVVVDEDGIPEYQTKPRMLNKQEMYTVYGVGVYAAGIALSFSGATPLLAGVAATKAFGHSITLHAGFKAMSGLLDDVFLGAEAVESVALAKGLDAGVNTGQIPGLNQIWDAISEAVVKISAEEKAPKLDDSQKFLHDFMMKVYTETAKSFENLSDKDMEIIMKNGVAPQGSSPKGKTADMSEQASLALMKMLSRLTRKLGVSDHVYVVGGAVRNFVINQPIKDIDVVIDSLALGKDSEWLANQVAREIPATTQVVTDQYGVSKVFVHSSWVLAGHEMMDPKQAAVEIANARKESYGGAAGKGYKPDQVDPATIEEDVLRREFTFNTLMWRLTDVAQGPDKAEIIDLTGCGLRDLKDRSMKCPSDPDTTFSDDPSRMLRAVKFIMKYDMKLTPDTEAAIRRNIRKLRNAPYEAVAVILEDTLLKDKAAAKKALPEMKRLGLLDEIADWIRSSKPFRSRMEGWVNSKPMLYLFDLMEVGLPLGANLNFLDRKQQTRLRQIALGMQDKEAKHLLAVLRQVGKAMDTGAIAKEFGLVKKAIGDMQVNVARPLVLENPRLAWDPKKLTDAVRQELRRRKTAGSPLVQLNINLGEGEAVQKIIPSNSVPYLLDNVKVEQVQKVARDYVHRKLKQGSKNSPTKTRLAKAQDRFQNPRHVEMLAHVWNWGSPLVSRPAYGQFYSEEEQGETTREASRWVGWHEDDDRAWDKNKAKLPETTRLSDLKFEIKGSGPWITVKVSAGDGWVGVITSSLVKQDEMLENGWVSLAESLRAFGESVGRPEMGVYAVSHSTLWDRFQGYGAGKRAYTMLLKEAYKRGHAAGPHGSWQNKGFRLTSDDAQRVWRKLGKMPGVKVADDHPFYYGDPKLERVGPDRPRGFQRGKKKYRRRDKHPHAQRAAASRVAAKYKNKKQVDKADGSGKTTVYEYTKGQVDHRNREKAKKVEKLRGQLGDLQAQVKKDLKSSDEKTRNLALVVGLINDTYERVGNDDSAEDGHFGVTGWQAQHVSVSGGKAHFTYVGKSGVKQKKTTDDASLVKAVEAALQGKSGEDALFSVGSQDVNEYLKPFDITAKDIRGLHANRVMQGHLKDLRAKGGKLPEDKKERDEKLKDEFNKALEATAGDVGHEAATLRGQYLVPGLEDNYLKDGSVVDNLAKQATKSQAEKDDEQAERMSRPAPSNKPPRKDLRRNRVEVDDKDVESQGADNDRDLSLNYKRVARGIYAEAIQRVLDQQLRSLVAGKIPKDAPEKKPGDYWESNNGWRAIAPDAKDGKSSPAKDEESAKAIATGKSKPEKTPDEQKAEAEEEAKAKEKAKAQAKAEAKRRAKSFDNQISTMLDQMPEGLASAVKRGLPEKGSKEYQQIVDAYSESVEFFIESEETRQMSGLVSKAFKALKLYEDKGKDDKGDKDDTGDKNPLEGMTPDRMGEFIAAAHYATEVAANPTIIGGRKLNGAKEPAELIERGSEAAREFASASPEIRKVAALKAAKVLAEMPMDDPNRLEMEVIVDGLVVAAAANGEDLPEQLDRPHMSKGSKALCKYMVKNGTEDMLLGSFDDYYGPKGRAAVGEALSHMKDEELADVSEDTGWGPLAEKLKDKNVPEEQKEWIRQWLREQGVEDMTTTQEVLEVAAKQSSVNQAEMEEKFAKDIAGTKEHKDWLRKLLNPPKGTTFADLNAEYQTWRSQYYLDWLKAQDIELPVTHPVIARHQHVVSTGDTSIRDEKLFTPAPEKTLDQKKQDYLQNAENLSPEDRQRVLSMPAQDFEAMMSAVSEEDEPSDETFKQAKFRRSWVKLRKFARTHG